MSPTRPEALVAARQDSGLSQEQLWLRYFALGGMTRPLELEAVVHDALRTSAHDRDIVIHALNERFTELGRDHPVPYCSDPQGGCDTLAAGRFAQVSRSPRRVTTVPPRDVLDDAPEHTGSTGAEAVEAMLLRLKPRLRGVLHEVAFAISLVAGTVLVMQAPPGRATLGAVIYAGAVALLFGTSAAYHRNAWSTRGAALMQRLDHSLIYVLIAGTYTPLVLLVLHGTTGWVLLSAIWSAALAGVVIRNLRPRDGRWLFTSFYLAFGGSALLLLPAILSRAGVTVVLLLAVGGLCYALGAIVYARQRPNPSPDWFGFHEVFHALTLLAFGSHYLAISLLTYRPRP